MNKKNISTEKMVVINGVAVPASKAEGRMKALANGRRIRAEKDAALAATRREEKRELRENGWTDSEITQKFLVEETEMARARGFIQTTSRIKRTSELPFGSGLMFH